MYEQAGPSTRPWQTFSPHSSLALENSGNSGKHFMLRFPADSAASEHQADIVSQDIRITLTSTRDPKDVRHLTLKPGKPCLIGRASKTKGEDHQASPNNALFDCPVVSRQHAEIKSHPWSPTGDQVTIIDYGSMHGTRVNYNMLERGRNMTLRDGDVIEFGDKVTRGDGMSRHFPTSNAHDCTNPKESDTHNSVKVTYRRVPGEHSRALAADAPPRSIGYRGDYITYISDDEDEDLAESVGDDNSVISDDGFEQLEHSSSKTTPEQRKASVGSQENPIQLDQKTSAFVDLTDDQIVESSPQAILRPAPGRLQLGGIELINRFATQEEDSSQPRIPESNDIVQDSIGKVKSVEKSYRPRSPGFYMSSNMNTAGNASFVGLRNSSSPVHIDDNSHMDSDLEDAPEDPKISEGNDESDGMDEEEEGLDDDDLMSDDEDLEDVSLVDEDALQDGVSLYDQDELDREPSPELGSDTGFIDESSLSPAKPNTSSQSVNKPSPPTIGPTGQSSAFNYPPLQPPFDPVRPTDFSSRPEPSRTSYSYAPFNQPSHYNGNGPSHFQSPYSEFRPRAPLVNSPPILPPQYRSSTFSGLSMPPRPPPPSGYMTAPPPPPANCMMAPPPPQFHGMRTFGLANPFPTHAPPAPQAVSAVPLPFGSFSGGAYPPVPPYALKNPELRPILRPTGSPTNAKSPADPAKAAEQQIESEKNKISIDELVEDGAAKASPEMVASTGLKRKAAEISEDEVAAASDKAASGTTSSPQLNESLKAQVSPALPPAGMSDDIKEPTPRRRRVSAQDDVSTAVAVEAPTVQEVPNVPKAGSVIGGIASMFGWAAVGGAVGGAATFAFLTSPLSEKVLESFL